MINPCIKRSDSERQAENKLRSMRDLFDGKPVDNIDGKRLHIDSALVESYGTSDTGMGDKMFREIVWRSTYKPVEAAESFKDADWRRISKEIQKESNGLRNPSLSFLEKYGFVRRGVMRKHAVTNWFNNQINATSNYERVKYGQFSHRNREVSRILRQEVLKRNGQHISFLGIKAEKQLEKLENKLFEILHNIAEAKYNRKDTLDLDKKANLVRDQIVDVLDSKGGKVLFEFVEYMNKSPDKITGKIHKEDGTEYSKNIVDAGLEARKMLNEMGDVYIKGLLKHREVINMAILNSHNPSALELATPLGRRVKKYHERVSERIESIKEGMKEGNYFPHYLMETMFRIEREMEKINNYENITTSNADSHLTKIESFLSTMRDEMHRSPISVKDRKTLAYDNWIKNPLAVLKKYGLDAMAFNKNQHLQVAYARTLKHMPKNGEAAEAMNKYITDVYTLAGKGFTDRPTWVNKTVRVITGFEFLSKLGFGIGTAARNMLSGMYFIQGIGNRKFLKYMTDWNNKSNKDIVSEIRKVEEESGFKFEDMAEELYTEGLVPTKGVLKSDIEMVVDSNGKPSFRYKEGNTWKVIDSSLSKAAGYGAVFQRLTENFLRRHMFRASFFTKYKELKDSGVSSARVLSEKSKSFALDIVNKYAFEYAAHQKAPIAGGHAGALGASGQILFQFFHYPMSFLQSQSEILRNSKDAVLAGQWNNPDVMIPIRFASLSLMTHLMSGVFNRDLTRLMENDTVDRIKELIKVLNGEEDIKGRGYVGPAVGDLIFWSSLNELITLPDNKFVDLIVGYNNAYKLTDDQKGARMLSSANVQLSKIVNKHIPTLQSGGNASILMHEFGTYPRAWTRKLHKKIWGKHSKFNKTKSKKSKNIRKVEPYKVYQFKPTKSFASKYSQKQRKDMLNYLDDIV